MVLLLLYQDEFINEIIFYLFHKTTIKKATYHIADILRTNKIVYLLKYNIITKIFWLKALLIKRQNLTFDKDNKAIEF